jgi:hypothetical protein
MNSEPNTDRVPARPLRARWLALPLALVLGAGCGEEDEEKFAKRGMKMEEVPAAAMDAAKAKLPNVTFEDVWRNVDKDGATHSFEIRGKAANGKIREVRVTEDGKILEVE